MTKKLPHLSEWVPLHVWLNIQLHHITLVDKPHSNWDSCMELTGLVKEIHKPGHPACQSRHFLITACVDARSWCTRRNDNHGTNFCDTTQMVLLSCGIIMIAWGHLKYQAKTMQLHMDETTALVHITFCTPNKKVNNYLTFGRHFVGYNHLSLIAG